MGRKIAEACKANRALVAEAERRQREGFFRMEFKTRLDTFQENLIQTWSDASLEKGFVIVRTCMEALTRCVDLGGDSPTPEQLTFFIACLRAQCRNIFGDSLMFALDRLAQEYGFDEFNQYIIIEMARRRGKSKGIGLVNGIFLSILPRYHGIIINLDSGVAEQGIGYAADVIKFLEYDPERVFPVDVVRRTVDTLEVRSIWGTINTLYSSPNIQRTGGSVRHSFLERERSGIFFKTESTRDRRASIGRGTWKCDWHYHIDTDPWA